MPRNIRNNGYEQATGNQSFLAKDNDGIPYQQNKKTHTVYAFKNGCENAKYSDDDEDTNGVDLVELSELRSRNSSKKTVDNSTGLSKSEIINHSVSKSESLQGIALKYGCTMSELKLANGIYKEQDFHALKNVKVPVHQFSLHLEPKDDPKTNVSTAKKSIRKLLDLPLPEEEYEEEFEVVATSPLSSGSQNSLESYGNNTEGLNSFLKHVDKGIDKVCQNLELNDDNNLGIDNVPLQLIRKEESLGAIYGVSWRGFLITLCILAVVLPGLGLVYYNFVRQNEI